MAWHPLAGQCIDTITPAVWVFLEHQAARTSTETRRHKGALMQTRMLTNCSKDIAKAAQILRSGGLVALPTETVYGLGADAGSSRAVASIYAAKGRPSFNPLIVHVHDVPAAQRLVHWSETADRLTQAFWPGPLTLVLPIRDDAPISRLATAGLDTLAVRIPAHPVTRAVLTCADVPVAAPSANPSGQISPTRAAHVLQGLKGRIDAIMDAGPCPVGIESTILSLMDTPKLLRPGGITEETLVNRLGGPLAHRSATDAISASGQMQSHYAPNASVRLNAVSFAPNEARLGFGHIDCDLNLSQTADLSEAASNLFDHLRELDNFGCDQIAVSPIPDNGLGVAINDRLRRAAAPRD
jgi:L-threonylcarbamoyladenylate synthase